MTTPSAECEAHVAAVLDAVEAGSITAEQGVRRLLARPVSGARRRGLRAFRLELPRSRRALRLRLPFVLVASVLIGLELVVFPLVYCAVRLAAWLGHNEEIKKAVGMVPIFPVSRLMLVLLWTDVPAGIDVRDGSRRVTIGVD